MSIKIRPLLLSAILLTLTACASSSPPTPPPSPTPAPPAAASPSPTPSPTAVAKHGGQIVQSGDYHLELLAIPEGENMHVDFWLLKSSDSQSIGNAKVTATVQFPNGTQKTVPMTYDEAGKHYKAYIPGYAAGDYRVVVQTDQQGKKVNGRFNFKL